MKKQTTKALSKELIIDSIISEPKTRQYILLGSTKPPFRQINTRHCRKTPVQWFNPETKIYEPLRLSTGHNTTVFMNEQVKLGGEVFLQRMGFVNGAITLSERAVAQQLLLAFHPGNKDNGGRVFEEVKPEEAAEINIDSFVSQGEAFSAIGMLGDDPYKVEQVMFKFVGESVFTTGSSELKRDLYIKAQKEPKSVINAIDDDVNELRYIARKAVKEGVIRLSADKRAVFWGKTGKTKLCTIPIDKETYEGIATFLLTDDGFETKKTLLDKLNK